MLFVKYFDNLNSFNVVFYILIILFLFVKYFDNFDNFDNFIFVFYILITILL